MIKQLGIVCLLVFGGAGTALASDPVLRTNEHLFPNNHLVSTSGMCEAVMQGDGNFVVYFSGSDPVWGSGTERGVGGWAAMQGDGNFVIYNWADRPVFATNTAGNPGAALSLDNNCELFVAVGGRILWRSGERESNSLATEPVPPSVTTLVTGNTDRLGGDYKDVIPTQARFSWCGFFCSTDSLCRAYTFVPAGVKDNKPHCFLKNTVPPATARTGMVSGRVLIQ